MGGVSRVSNYVLKLDLPIGAGPMPTETPKGPIDVYLLSGQSNMNGLGDASYIPPDWKKPIPRCTFFEGAGLVPFIPGAANTMRGGRNFGPEVGFAKQMSLLRPDRDFAVIKHAAGGQPLHHGMNGTDLGRRRAPGRESQLLSWRVQRRPGKRPVVE